MAETTNFNSEDHGIPQDTFDYIAKMLKDNGVAFKEESSLDNPRLRMAGMQQCEDAEVRKLNDNLGGEKIEPRQMRMATYKHFTVTLSTDNKVRVLRMSKHKMI